MWPTNEAETIELYRLIEGRLGWRIVHLQTAFPDAVIESEDGDQLVVEFEFLSKNFRQHNHDSNGCQLIICWVDNWPDAPLPVQALADCAAMEAEMVSAAIRVREIDWQTRIDHWWAIGEHWRIEAIRLKNCVMSLRSRWLKTVAQIESENPALWLENPLTMLNDKAFKTALAVVFSRLAARLDAQLSEFFDD